MEIIELIEKVKQNDQAAFKTLYNEYYPTGFSLALQFVKNDQDAMDIIQDVFLTVCLKLDTLDDATKFKSWYMQIVANKCRDFLKKKNPLSFTDANAYDEDGNMQFDIEDDDRDFKPEEAVDYSETVRIVDGMLDKLPADQKMCLLLYYVNGLKISEIAESLELSEATVKSRLKYGKDKLRAQVEDYEKRNGIKLRGVAGLGLIPFIKWMMNGSTSATPIVTTTTATTTITAAEAGKVAVKTVAKEGGKGVFAKIAGMSIAHKIVSAVVAGAIFVGGAVGVVNIAKSDPLPKFDMSKYITFNTDSYEQDGIVYYDIDHETAIEEFLTLADKEKFYDICEECFTDEEIERGITLANFIVPMDEYAKTLHYTWSIDDNKSVTFRFAITNCVDKCLFPKNEYDEAIELFKMMGVTFDPYVTLQIESLPETKYVEPENRRIVDFGEFVKIDVVNISEDKYRVNANLNKKELLLELLQCNENELEQISEFEYSNPEFFTSRNIDPKNFNTRLDLALENIEIEVWNFRTFLFDDAYTVFSYEDNVNIRLEGIHGLANIFGIKFDANDSADDLGCFDLPNYHLYDLLDTMSDNEDNAISNLGQPNLAEDFSYYISDGELYLGGYHGSEGSVVIPDTINGYPVRYIGAAAFKMCKNATSITIPDGVCGIGIQAFVFCENLTSVTIPNSVKSINDDIFVGCTNLDTVIYKGSISEWKALCAESYISGPFVYGEVNVICTDGTLVLPIYTDDYIP